MDDSLEELQARRGAPSSTAVDVDENDLAETYVLPGADQLDEELTVTARGRRVRQHQAVHRKWAETHA